MEAMDTQGNGNDDGDQQGPLVTVHHTSPDRVVFTEDGNSDAWISTDTSVELEP